MKFGDSPALLLFIASGLVSAPIAKAQTSDGIVNLQFQSMDQAYSVDVYGNGTPPGSTDAQGLSPAIPNSSSLASSTAPFELFCIELGEGTPSTLAPYEGLGSEGGAVAGSTSVTDPTEPGNATGGTGGYNATRLELLYGNASGKTGTLSGANGSAGLSAADLVPFKLSVWRLSNEAEMAAPATLLPMPGGMSAFGFSVTGNVSANVICEADNLLNDINKDLGITPMALYAQDNGSYQDVLAPTDSFTQVPEPASSAAILGCVAMAWTLVRRRAVALRH